MKTKVVLLFLLASIYSVEAFSKGKDPKQEEKKTTKSKYDFNVFKLISINASHHQSDSTKAHQAHTKSSGKGEE